MCFVRLSNKNMKQYSEGTLIYLPQFALPISRDEISNNNMSISSPNPIMLVAVTNPMFGFLLFFLKLGRKSLAEIRI